MKFTLGKITTPSVMPPEWATTNWFWEVRGYFLAGILYLTSREKATRTSHQISMPYLPRPAYPPRWTKRCSSTLLVSMDMKPLRCVRHLHKPWFGEEHVSLYFARISNPIHLQTVKGNLGNSYLPYKTRVVVLKSIANWWKVNVFYLINLIKQKSTSRK